MEFFVDLVALFMLLIEDCIWHQLLAEREAKEQSRIEQEKAKESKEKERAASGLSEKKQEVVELTGKEENERENQEGKEEEEIVETETYLFARKLMDTIGRLVTYVSENSWV